MRKRVLVLTSSTGSGHDMRAKAFAEWVDKLHGANVEVRIEHVIEDGSLLGRFGVWVYNTIQSYAPFLHNLYFFIVELFVISHSNSVSFGGRHYRHLLGEFRPDIVLSVHDSTNKGYFEDAKRVLGTVRCVTYCGEFSGGYGFSRNWINPSVDCFIARTRATRDYAASRGIEPSRTKVFHKFLPPASFEPLMTDDEKCAYRLAIGLDPERFTVFLATGGFGANHHLGFLHSLNRMPDSVQVVVICGRNQKVRQRIERWHQENPGLNTFIEGYSTRVAKFMQISDAVVTRGGANTTMEALHFGCPVLYNSLGGLMPQERCTVRYFIDHGAAVMVKSARHLATVVDEWRSFGPTYQEVKNRLQSLHHEEDPRQLVDWIIHENQA